MPSFSSTASLQSWLATARDPQTWFILTWQWPVSWFFCSLAFPTQWQLLFQGIPCPVLGVSLCITCGEWLAAAPPCAPPVSWAPISPSVSSPGERSGWCSEEGPPRSFLLHLLVAQFLNVHPCSSENHWSTEHAQLYWYQRQVVLFILTYWNRYELFVVHLWCYVYWRHGLVQWLHGASPAETPPEGAVYSHPHWAPQMPPRDQSRPHHPDACGHLHHLLLPKFCFVFLYCSLLWYSSMVDRDL